MWQTSETGGGTGVATRTGSEASRVADQLTMESIEPPDVVAAERLTREARAADAARAVEIDALYRAIVHTFAKLAAVERRQREVERRRMEAEEAWRAAGLTPLEAQRRVGVQREPPYELVGQHAHRWMKPILAHLRAARNDFTVWWRL